MASRGRGALHLVRLASLASAVGAIDRYGAPVIIVDFGTATTIDLVAFELTLGFSVHVNLMSVIGVFLVAQLLRWVR